MNATHTWLAATLALAVLAEPSTANEPAETLPALNDGALSTVVYDISDLGGGSQSEQIGLSVMPFLEEWDEDDRSDSDLSEPFYSLLVDSLYSDEFQYEGREIELMHDERLLVTAPASVHSDIAALLQYLDRASSRQAQVRWDIYDITGAPDGERRLGPQSLQAMIDGGVAVLLQSRTETVALGRTVRRGSERTQQLLSTWDSEIAASSTGNAASPRNLIGGLTLLLRVEDVPGTEGQRLRMVQRMVGEPTLESTAIEAPERVVMESGTASLSQQRFHDLFRAEATTVAASGVLLEGEALLSSAWCRTVSGVSGRLTRLVLEHVDPAPAPLQIGGLEVRLMDLSAFYWAGFDGPIIPAERMQGREDSTTKSYREDDEELSKLTFPGEDIDWDVSVAHVVSPLEWEDGGSIWSDDNWMLLAGQGAAVASRLSKLPSRLPTSEAVLFEWGLENGAGSSLAGGRLDLEQHADGLVMVGEALSYLHGSEVDVASNAMNTETQLAEALDGLWLVVHANGRGSVEIDVARNHLVSLSDARMGQGNEGIYHRAVFDSSDVTLRCAADGKRHELAELSASPGNAKFWVRATLR